jgi:hypothetical protein
MFMPRSLNICRWHGMSTKATGYRKEGPLRIHSSASKKIPDYLKIRHDYFFWLWKSSFMTTLLVCCTLKKMQVGKLLERNKKCGTQLHVLKIGSDQKQIGPASSHRSLESRNGQHAFEQDGTVQTAFTSSSVAL